MTARCPRCCAPIPLDGPQGLCPKCLLAVGMGEPEVILTASGEPAPPPPDPKDIAPHFPQLEIVRLIGRGGMGAVYEARQKGLQRAVALKILAAPSTADAKFEERFVRESQALARLSHENIVAVHDAGRAGPHFYLLMEYVDGPNLRQALKAGRIEPAQALALVMQICTALEYAHRQGIVHRDIKPENVLLTRDGQVKIADFGLAKVLDRAARGLTLTRASQAMGTPHYMAPEQIEHPQQVDHRADIYSLGVVLYELLTGELPLGRFPLPSQKVQVDVRLDDIVLRTLEKEPERRYQAASEVRTAVNEVANGAPARAVPVAPARKPRRVWPWVVAAAVLALFAIPLGVMAVTALLLAPRAVVARTGAHSPGSLDAVVGFDRRHALEIAREQARVQEDRAQAEVDRARAAEQAQLFEELGRALERAQAPQHPPEPALAPHPIATPHPPALADSPQLRQARQAAERTLAEHGGQLVRRYLELEAAATSIVAPLGPDELAHVRIRAFPDERGALSAELWTLLADRLSMDEVGLLMGSAYDRTVLAYGETPCEVRITKPDGIYVVVERNPGTSWTRTTQMVDLPERYARLLARDRALR